MNTADEHRSHLPGAPPAPTGAYRAEESASILVRVLDQYFADLQAGRAPERAQLLAAHPDLAPQLEQCLAGIEFIHHAAQPSTGTPAQIGDFRIVREVGRGGMGVVYEAEQLSLKRKVALKVLRFGAVADAEVMQRFQREAETVARLHHTNIVPIFAVGCDQGVHYYAMQFIDGHSLADVLQENRQAGGEPLPAAEVARWGLQAAEALAHAHRRGVIHRDIKPSNLLLDAEGVLWLTDFGLAKRADEVTFTLAGVLMGTPRYMSPEQAATVKQPIDHRTDIYSLGATLYELATGQPVFQADTPNGVLNQILNAEPVAPRQVRPTLPRDLETIILKCLSKEPDRRYATAEALAADLRAFLEGRAIKARRPSLAEQVLRWARRQRRSAVLAAVTAAASVLLVIGASFAWGWYTEWQMGQLVLTTEGPGLEAEILDDTNEPAQPSFAVSAARQSRSLKAGTYRLRLSAPGQLSETFQVLVEQGVQRSFAVNLGDRQLWEPLDIPRGYEIVELDGRADVIVATETGLRRMNGATGKEIWTKPMNPVDQPALKGIKDFQWRYWYLNSWVWAGPSEPFGPWLVRPAPDLDGDGSRTLVWASPTAPVLLAVAADKGTVKWGYTSARPGPADEKMGLPEPACGVACPPLVEVDREGKSCLIAVFGPATQSESMTPQGRHVSKTPRWVEAVSGPTGRSLWRFTFPEPENVQQDPEGLQRRLRYGAAVTSAAGKRILMVLAGRHLVQLDAQTGQPLAPAYQLSFDPINTPVFADLKGDGQTAVLLVREDRRHHLTLTALSPDGTVWWEHPVGRTANQSGRPSPPCPWPLVQDLDGSGKRVVIVPYNGIGEKDGWVGLEALDAKTGQSLWRRRLARAYWGSADDNGMAHFLAGPDLDGDGCRDLVTCTLIHGRTYDDADYTSRWLLVAAVSGADGRILWRSLRPLTGNSINPILGPPRWGPLGPDGRPCLMVTLTRWQLDKDLHMYTARSQSSQTFLFSAGTGKLEQTWPGFADVNMTDFNGDGLPDLYGIRPETNRTTKLHVLRGGPPEVGRWLGTWQPGIAPISRDENGPRQIRLSLPDGDLDGDGTPDVLVFHPADPLDAVKPPPLQAYAGKDGRRLWKVDDLKGSPEANQSIGECFYLASRDLDGNGRPEVLFGYRFGRPGDTGECWLAVLTGRNGKIRWKVKLGGGSWKGASHSFSPSVPSVFVDVNGDGVLDVVVPIEVAYDRYELRALDGRNGRTLWQHPLPNGHPHLDLLAKTAGGGPPDVLVATSVAHYGPPPQDPHHGRDYHTQVVLSALNAKDGKPQWTWSGPADNQHVAWRVVPADLEGRGRCWVCQWAIRDWNSRRTEIVILDPEGQPRHTVDLTPPSDKKERGGLWVHDLDGSGREQLVFVSHGKVRALGVPFDKPRWEWPLPEGTGRVVAIQPTADRRSAVVVVRAGATLFGLAGPTGQPLWERPLPDGARDIFPWEADTAGVFVWPPRDAREEEAGLRFQPVTPPAARDRLEKLTIVMVSSDNTVEGLDGTTGRSRWRCDGPGRLAYLEAGTDPDGLPKVFFHCSTSDSTLGRQALPLEPDGRYGRPLVTAIPAHSPIPDDWSVIPLPWEPLARKNLSHALIPSLACLGLLVVVALLRKNRILIGLLICVLVIPPLVGGWELGSRENRVFWSAEHQFAWGGWYWLWPYVFAVPTTLPVFMLLFAGILVLVFALPGRWCWIGLLALVFGLLLYFLASFGPTDGGPWWDQSVHIPGGLAPQSPLVWMMAWLWWRGTRAFWKARSP
jgi:outer membrane protein assembly factor BamB/tRNA A-37 threonylcarbamoyl transferase component Bud32